MVPTWNYITAHVYGELVVHDDPVWVEDLVRRLTGKHEADQEHPWSVDDAPRAFIEGQLRAIVGVELVVSRIEAKAKLSQNRPAADVAGVIAGLRERGDVGRGRGGVGERLAPESVGYANDPKRHLSATPSTPVEAVAGVGDRRRNLSATPSTPLAVGRYARRWALRGGGGFWGSRGGRGDDEDGVPPSRRQRRLPGLRLAVVDVPREFQDGGGERLGGFLGDQVPDSLESH